MVSQLDSALAKAVYQGFKGKLSVGRLRRETPATVDSYGDPEPAEPVFFPFEGIRDSFSIAYAGSAGIELTDAKILIIAQSVATVPVVGDKVFIRAAWYEIRTIVAVDPANATYTLAGFSIVDPDG